jgi:hypothetical protein
MFHYAIKQHNTLLFRRYKKISHKIALENPIILIRLFYQNENDYAENVIKSL